MTEFSHSTKRAINRIGTPQRVINSKLNQEFVDTRRRLQEIYNALRGLNKSIATTRQSWNAVVRQQRDFTTRLSNSFPQSGDVQEHAAEVEAAMRDVQKALILSDAEESPHQKICEVLDRYLEVLRGIQEGHRGIEILCTEKMRYERKVDALEKRKYRPNPEKLTRNLEKLAETRDELDAKVNEALVRMRAAFQKHEAVLQCAHHAFWMANNIYLSTIEEATRDIRVETVNVHQLLMDIELDEDKTLMPVPRSTMIENNTGDTTGSATVVEDAFEEEVEEQPVRKQEPDEIEKEEHAVSTVTSEPSFHSDTQSVGERKKQLEEKVKLNIPDVPTKKPITVTVPVAPELKKTTPAVEDSPQPIAA